MRSQRNTARFALTFLVAGLFLSTWAVAEQKVDAPAAEFGEMVEVSEVLLDVLVTDKSGNVVLGLDKDDFVVRQGKEDQDLTGVSFYSNRFQLRDGEEGIQKPLVNEVLADRYFILFFHNPLRDGQLGGVLQRRTFEAVREAQRWVEEQMIPGDWVAVASWDYKLKVQQDFTQDRALLVGALQDVLKRKDPENEYATRRPEVPEGQPTLLANLPEGKDLRKRTARIYDALRLVSEATGGILGRKNLVLFTAGFGELDASFPTARADERFYPELEQATNDNNVAIYAVDLKPTGSETLQEDFLNRLSTDTGGRYQGTFVSFTTPLEEIASEVNGYYLLSYQAEHGAGESGYQEVRVDTVNPELKVRARKGYRYGS